MIGIVGLYTETGDDRNIVWLGWYGVKESHRGQHIGSRLLDFAIKSAKEQGYDELHLYTTSHEEHRDAIALYERYGFKLYKEKKRSKTLYYKL